MMILCKYLPLIAAFFSFAAGVAAGQGYDVAVEDTMRRVRIDVPYTGEHAKAGALTVRPHPGSLPKPPGDINLSHPGGINREAKISAAQGESEGFQAVILAKDLDLQDMAMSASALTLVGGNPRTPQAAKRRVIIISRTPSLRAADEWHSPNSSLELSWFSLNWKVAWMS